MRSKAAVPVQPRSDRGPTQITMTEVSDIPGDSKFARALASSDYHVRSKGLAALYVWLQRKQSVPDMGLQKLWRGIMFCFWHSDKSHVQQQLADQLVKIMMDLSDEVALSYFQAFLQTMYREWGAIDKLRLDKFMMLVRRFIKGMFLMLQDRGWDCGLVGRYADCIRDNAFSNTDGGQQIGFSLHLADVYIPELLAVENDALQSSLPHDQCVRLLQPWIAVLSRSKQPTLVQRIKNAVLEEFADALQSTQEKGKHNCFTLVEPSRVADSIFEAGAAMGVPPKNRAALYDASEILQRSSKKRRREPYQPAVPSRAEPVVGKVSDAGTGSNAASDRVHSPDTCSPQLPPKKKKVRLQARAGICGAIEEPGNGNEDPQARFKGVHAGGGAHAFTGGLSKSGKKRLSKGQASSLGAAVNGASTRHSNGSVHLTATTLTPRAEKALSGALNKIQHSKSKKRISFDLSKNVVWKANQPLPPAALRTPPSAKPNGSALKTTSSVVKSKVARRISF